MNIDYRELRNRIRLQDLLQRIGWESTLSSSRRRFRCGPAQYQFQLLRLRLFKVVEAKALIRRRNLRQFRPIEFVLR